MSMNMDVSSNSHSSNSASASVNINMGHGEHQHFQNQVSLERMREICDAMLKENPTQNPKDLITVDRMVDLMGESRSRLIPLVRKYHLDRERENAQFKKFHGEIEKYVEIILKLAGKEFEDKIKNLWDEIEERDREYALLAREIEDAQMIIHEKEKEARQIEEQVSKGQSFIKELKDEYQKKDNEAHALVERNKTLENEIRVRLERSQKMELDYKKLTEELDTLVREARDKEKRNHDLHLETQSFEQKMLSLESILKAKDDSIEELRKNFDQEKDESKKYRRESMRMEEENFRLQSETERLRGELRAMEEKIGQLMRKGHLVY